MGIDKNSDGQNSVTVKFGKTRDGHVRDVAVTGPGQIQDGTILIWLSCLICDLQDSLVVLEPHSQPYRDSQS